MQLRIPGPTPCPPQALEAMGRQMINHRGPEFARIINSVTERLKQVFQTKGDVLVLTTSGTGGLESAVVNTLSPGDAVLSVSNGFFGDRFGDIAEAYGAEVTRLNFEWGKPVDPDAVDKALKTKGNVKAVLATHNETSTGVTNDIKALSTVVKKSDTLLLVDAISSLGCIDLPVDAWDCDVVVTASQKGWMVPPGLAMVSVNERAWQARAKARMPRYYFDFVNAKDFLQQGQTPWTPAVSLFFALDVTLDLMLREGLNNIFARHARVAQVARAGIRSLGFHLFADERFASNTVTAVSSDDKIDVGKLIRLLREQHQVVIAGGQEKLSGKIFRIGHLGLVHEEDMKLVVEAIRNSLPKARKS